MVRSFWDPCMQTSYSVRIYVASPFQHANSIAASFNTMKMLQVQHTISVFLELGARMLATIFDLGIHDSEDGEPLEFCWKYFFVNPLLDPSYSTSGFPPVAPPAWHQIEPVEFEIAAARQCHCREGGLNPQSPPPCPICASCQHLQCTDVGTAAARAWGHHGHPHEKASRIPTAPMLPGGKTLQAMSSLSLERGIWMSATVQAVSNNWSWKIIGGISQFSCSLTKKHLNWGSIVKVFIFFEINTKCCAFYIRHLHNNC